MAPEVPPCPRGPPGFIPGARTAEPHTVCVSHAAQGSSAGAPASYLAAAATGITARMTRF